MSNNKKTKKVAEDKAALNNSLFAKLLCIKDSKGRQNFSLRKLAYFFLTGIGCWWLCIHWYIDTREYASHDLTLMAFMLAFLGSFVPILSLLIGITEKLEVRTTERLTFRAEFHI